MQNEKGEKIVMRKTYYRQINKRILTISGFCIILVVCFAGCNKDALSNENQDMKMEKKTVVATMKDEAKNQVKKGDEFHGLISQKRYEDSSRPKKSEEVIGEKYKPDELEKKKVVNLSVLENHKEKDENKEIMVKPQKKKVWVVDTPKIPAWDEEVDNYDFPIGYDREYYWINVGGKEERYYNVNDFQKKEDELDQQGILYSWGNGIEFIKTGYKKKNIHHEEVPEKGHWEWK